LEFQQKDASSISASVVVFFRAQQYHTKVQELVGYLLLCPVVEMLVNKFAEIPKKLLSEFYRRFGRIRIIP